MRLARRYEQGAEKYGDRNWEKGQPFSRVTDSMLRHAQQWLAGDDSEDHLAAVAWNAFALMTYQARIERGDLPAELDDMPQRPKVCVESTLGGNVLHVTGDPGNVTIPPIPPEKADGALDNLAYAIKGNPESVARMADALTVNAEEIADRMVNDEIVAHPLPDWLHRHAWGWSMVVREENYRREVIARADHGQTSLHKHERLSHDVVVLDGSVEVVSAPTPDGPWTTEQLLVGQTKHIRAGVWHRLVFIGEASIREVYHRDSRTDSWHDIARHDEGSGPYANS